MRRRWTVLAAVAAGPAAGRAGPAPASHRFRGVPGTYPIRLRIRRQARFPFVLGYSRTVRVRVR